MRMSRMFLHTLKEVPQEAEIPSHILMIRSGMLMKVASGIYDYLPLAWRAIRKAEQIVREEMDAAGGQELLMPAITPAELWVESGRWEVMGENMFRLKDRHKRDFGLGMTHEEIITDIVRRSVRSYRELPLILYQIQTKFRDEPRPRGGINRAREFIMKDMYSFHISWEDLDVTYKAMYRAYSNVFLRAGLDFKVVEADSGTMGGDECHEFMLPSESGEDTMFLCGKCGYSANSEMARFHYQKPDDLPPHGDPIVEIDTPGVSTIDDLVKFLKRKPSDFIKCLIYRVDGELVAALVRGDRDLNETKLRKALGAKEVELATPREIEKATGGPLGFSGPVGLKGIKIIADYEIQELRNAAVGANKADTHIINVSFGRDFEVDELAELRQAVEGDCCPRCHEKMTAERGIELGHIFKLGTKYSDSMKATYLDEKGEDHPIIMGCYGIGVTRIISAAIEKGHDKDGIIWPMSLAPYHVVVMPVVSSNEDQASGAEKLYRDLLERGIETVLDDRDLRPGVKFKDADLLGFPIRAMVGERAIEQGGVEIKIRGGEKPEMVPADKAADYIVDYIKKELDRLNGLRTAQEKEEEYVRVG
ncbi:MAG: proline--tRNA ligase [Chloroflexi bacterium]|nr:proline--tRNA ligase [Chloroflexota bacterium]